MDGQENVPEIKVGDETTSQLLIKANSKPRPADIS